MNARFFRRGFSALAVFGTAAMLAGAMNQGCVCDSSASDSAAPQSVPDPVATLERLGY